MKHIVFLVIVSFATATWAQDKQVAKEPAKAEAREGSGEVGSAQAGVGRPAHAARAPLERGRAPLPRAPSNTEIIKCAEEYL